MMLYLISMRTILIFFVTFSTTITVEDFDNSYLAEPGDVFSADLFNEQHANIKNVLKTWSSVDLVGKWSCNLYTDDNNIWGSYAATFGAFDGIYKTSVPHVYTFKNDGDGTFSVESSINLGLIAGLGGGAKSYSLIGKVIFSSGTNAHFSPMSNTRFLLSMQSVWIESSYRKSVEICDKTHQSSNPNNNSDSETWQSLAPNKHPTGLSINLIGTTVSLNWTDNASNETGYKIYRKSTRKGSFSLIHTTAANISSYQDSISSSSTATYWYKIVPINATGDGKPSKALKVRYTAQ